MIKQIRECAVLVSALVATTGALAEPVGKLLALPKSMTGAKVEVSEPAGSPFTYIRITPKAEGDTLAKLTVADFKLPHEGVADPWELVTQGTAGLQPLTVNRLIGSFGYMAVAEPVSRRGLVFGWLTDLKANGRIVAKCAEGSAIVTPTLDYGKCRVKPGMAMPTEVLVIGVFDDCRKGLEAYADAIAKEHRIRLPRQIAGYCTWYAEEPYGWGGDEKSTRQFAELVDRHGLKKWGFDFFQIDDYWQDGELSNGPGKNFTKVRADGPYPSGMQATFDNLSAHGIRPGVWFMPFVGTHDGAWWQDKQDLFLRTADGKPYETVWGGTVLDMTNPKAVDYLKSVTRRICDEWHCRYIKYDGMWTALGCKLGAGARDGLQADDFGEQAFSDPSMTGVEAYRAGVKALREAAGKDTFVLACNLAQSTRGMGPSYGLVDAMRVGGDNGPWERRWMIGVEPSFTRWFFNGRVWYNDPDPVYVRDARAVGKARLMASWTSVGGFFYNFSDWLGNLSEERLEILRRTMAPHGCRNVRPVELFEKATPNTWHLERDGYNVFAFCNWNTKGELAVDYAPAYAGLEKDTSYAAFDYWNDRFLGVIRNKVALTVPSTDCRVISMKAFDGTKPVLLSTSRHVASPVFDVTGETWDEATKTLSGTSKTVPGADYELRIQVPADMTCVSAGAAKFVQNGNTLRVTCTPDGESLGWSVRFAKR